ncbi:MAG TPA: phage antirepressor N-terminal domain-containing protein [Ktedonobacterales bacterium]|nr:phage antirepressor N-terminal domain-containing protein [Ktedonobacterales bacterium]
MKSSAHRTCQRATPILLAQGYGKSWEARHKAEKTGERYVRHHVSVDVLDDYLWVAEDYQGNLYLPVRPICAALELDSATSIDTIKADSRLAPGLVRIQLPSAGGDQLQQCLRSEEYGWWLMIVDPCRFKPERRVPLAGRQRVLMRLAKDIVLKHSALKALPQQRMPQTADIPVSGQAEGVLHCLNCGAPHLIVIDGTGWHAPLSTTWSERE